MTYEELLAEIRALPASTPDERSKRIERSLDFTYSNLAATTNHKPTRYAFEVLSAGKGWSKAQFDAWANRREWW